MALAAGIEFRSQPVDRVISELSTRLSTPMLTTYLGTVHGYFLNKSVKMFQDEKDPYGNRWAPLADSTVAMRIYFGYGGAHPINERTGGLRESITGAPPDIIGHSDGVISMAFPRRATPSSDLMKKYAQASGLGKGPARRVIGMNEKDVAWILSTLNMSLFMGLGKGT
ncbi:hypothetical protein SEA_JUMBO_15 [Gordonia phage Jumbo]|uniref:Uncharacterized protein n=1 Tax=Gordonia phage Jumbo TaxID=1887650 RepID=A0A1B3B0R3_9CAUD|nr:tail completion or Neck1 protein [Gordonia phage Jumbo]AOE44528.1 hypothetical protein SEA_JUMBO_15 [Gordonia phage Jumbo]